MTERTEVMIERANITTRMIKIITGRTETITEIMTKMTIMFVIARRIKMTTVQIRMTGNIESICEIIEIVIKNI